MMSANIYPSSTPRWFKTVPVPVAGMEYEARWWNQGRQPSAGDSDGNADSDWNLIGRAANNQVPIANSLTVRRESNGDLTLLGWASESYSHANYTTVNADCSMRYSINLAD